jgi:HEAT repeat protein
VKLSKRTVVRGAVIIALAFSAAMLVPCWRAALFGPHRQDAVCRGHPTSYWRAEIVKYQSSPPPDGALGQFLVWLKLAEDRNDWAGRRRYPPLTTPGWTRLKPKPPDPDLLAVVLQLIEDDDARIRSYATGFLGEFAAWPEAIATATRLLNDPSPEVRLMAVMALGNMGPPARDALLLLVARMGDTHEAYHIYAAQAIWQIDRRKETVVPVLARALHSDIIDHRQWAINVLCEMGPDAEGAFAELCATSQDGDRISRMYALRLLGTFGKRSVPALVAGLSDPDSVVRAWALEALAKIGAEAHAAIPAVLRLQDDPVQYVRETAAKTLEQLAPEPCEDP